MCLLRVRCSGCRTPRSKAASARGMGVAKMRDASEIILSYGDRALGLAPPMGRKGGYRSVLESLVGDFLDNATRIAGISDNSI